METFEALLERNKHEHSNGEVHTIGEQDLRSSVDEYLRNEAKLEMNLEAFFEWKVREWNDLRESKNKSDRESWLERKNDYLFTKNKYNKCIAAAKEDWMLSKDGVVNGLCYNPKRCQYEATIKYMDENNVQKEAEMMVEYAWIVNEYGAVLQIN